MTDDNASVSLSEAAEELIKAAHRVVETSSQGKDLSSFKESLDAKINTVNQKNCQLKDQVAIINANIERQGKDVSSMKVSLDAKLNTLNENIHQQTKMQSLEWTINNLELFECHPFQYSDVSLCFHHVKKMLLCFRQGRGYNISDGGIARSLMSSGKTESEFRDTLVNYVYMLTGVMPRLQLEDNGKYVIYYS